MPRSMNHMTTVNHLGTAVLAARNFVKTASTLQFDISRNGTSRSINRLVVTLNDNDLYDVTGYSWKLKLDLVEVDKKVDIQAENLKMAVFNMLGV